MAIVKNGTHPASCAKVAIALTRVWSREISRSASTSTLTRPDLEQVGQCRGPANKGRVAG
jgi:hypothetical protein